ncbi:MAG: helix-turn-helix domain-containing protein [Gammaproteobacteria bacterium]
MFKILWKPKAARQIEKIKNKETCKIIFTSIEQLVNFTNCTNIKALKNHEYNYRLRVGKYRVFFDINGNIQVISIEEVKNVMKAHIEYQTITKNGKPEFVVLPYSDFLKIYSDPTISNTIPNEVMRLVINKDMSRIRAWREYLKITQKEVANKIGISQAALSQIEAPNSKIRRITLEKIAKALGLNIEQLR